MSYEDEVVSRYYSLSSYKYQFLESLSLRRSMEDRSSSEHYLNVQLSLVMATFDQGYVDGKLNVVFDGVRNLQVGDLNGILSFILEVRSLAGHQMEGLRFGVEETEYRALKFECFDVKVEVIREGEQ